MPPLSKTQSTGVERVVGALTRKPADRAPVAPLYCGATSRVAGITYEEWSRPEYWEEAADAYIRTAKLLDLDGLVMLIDLSVECMDFGQDVVFPTFDTAHPDYNNHCIKDPATDYLKLAEKIRGQDPLDPKVSPRMAGLVKMTGKIFKEIGSWCTIVGFVYDVIGILSMMRGPSDFFEDCIEYAEEVKACNEVMKDILIVYGQAQAKVAHSVCLDTLYGSQSILSKPVWDNVEGPYCRKFGQAMKDAGTVYTIHNCGTGPYFDRQIYYQSPHIISHAYLPDDCQTMEEMRKKWVEVREPYKTWHIDGYDDDSQAGAGSSGTEEGLTYTVACGMLQPSPLMFFGTREEIHDEMIAEFDAIDCKDQNGKSIGGWIACTGCEYPPNGNLNNGAHMVDASKLYCTND
jgi:uroporphyrinogen decarboxylase